MATSSRSDGLLLSQLSGTVALGLLLAAGLVGTGVNNGYNLGINGNEMWVKVLGLVCAGVFVGAALVEAVQLGRRPKGGQEPSHDSDRDSEQVEPERQSGAVANG